MALHVTTKLAYWHMPKTGGMSIYRIMRTLPNTEHRKILGPYKHGPPTEIPLSALKGRTLFGTVRDPWSWYLSVYQHASHDEEGKALLAQVGNGSSKFRDVLYGMTHPLDVIDMPEKFTCVYLVRDPIREAARSDYLGSGLGLCSWTFRHTYGRPARPSVFLDTSRLVEGMADLLCRPVEEILTVSQQNRAEHRPRSYIPDAAKLYDDEMTQWVADADAPLIETFGFTEPYGNAREVLMDSEHLQFSPSLR